MRAIIAVLVALCVMIPTLVFAALHGRADETVSRVTVDGLETIKTVSPVEGQDGVFHVKLEAYNTSEFINQPANDIILVLDDSSRMNTVLYHRDYKNLVTHTMFKKIDNPSYNTLHDGDNVHNDGSIDVGNNYSHNKYVEDPNTPGVYVYLATTYYKDSATGLTSHHYVYTFTDSYGNVYEYTTENVGSISSLIFSPGTEFEFHLVSENPVGNPKETVKISEFYQRDNSEENALTSELVTHAGTRSTWTRTASITKPGRRFGAVNYYDTTIKEDHYTASYNGTQLFILSDSGNRLPVTVDVEQIRYEETHVNTFGRTVTDASGDYISRYIFTATDPETGKVYRAVQGNEAFGADFGVFQGFKTYHYKTDPITGEFILDVNGNKILEVEHNNSIESKSLYTTKEGQDVTRLDATKEAVENFAIKVHQDAYYKGTDVRLGIVTYGKDGDVFQPLTSVYDEIGVNSLIDRVYHIETEKTNLGLSDSPAAQIDEGMEAAYNHFSTNSPAGNKRFAVAFTAGMPTKNYFGSNSREKDYNTDVATGAIRYAYKMKHEQAVNMYSVGMYEYARQNQVKGDWFHYTLWPSYPCSGEVGSIWGASRGAEILNGDEIDATDAAAVNRMMNYISGNYLDADEIGLYRRTLGLNPAGHIIATSVLTGKGYQITKNFQQTDTNHNFAVSTRNENGDPVNGDQINADLQAVFDQLAGEMQVAHGSLSSQTQLVDNITEYFDLIPESVTYKTMNYQGPSLSNSNCWTDDDVAVDPATRYPDDGTYEIEQVNLTLNNGEPITKDTKELNLSGFPFSQNYVVEDRHVSNKAQNYGKKVVLEFDIERNEDLIGGNHVPTNVANSGIYDEDSNLEEHFEVPYVDLSLKEQGLSKDQAIYYSYEANLAELFDEEKLNGFDNAFVDITYEVVDTDDPTKVVTFTVPAGETVPKQDPAATTEAQILKQYPQLDATKTYQINATINPENRPGAIRAKTLEPMDATVYVYVPALDVLDETVDPGTEVDLNPTAHDPAWLCDLNADADDTNDVENIPTPVGDAPELTYTIINKSNNDATIAEPQRSAYAINETQDFQVVDVTIPARTFSYLKETVEQAKDENNNPLTDDEGNPIMVTVVETVDVNRSAQVVDQDKVFFTNMTAPSKTNGDYTKYTGKAYDLYVTKTFTGDYVNPEGVRFTLTGSDGSTQTLDIAANEFTRLTSGEKKVADSLRTGVTYTIEESFLEETDIVYDTTATQKIGSATATNLQDTDANDGKAIFQFTVAASEDPGRVDIVVTNADTSEPPVVTGVSENEHTNYIWLIALASSAALSAGGYGMYRIKKKD